MPKLYYYKSFRYNILMEHAAGGTLLYTHGLANVHMQSSLGWDSDTSFTRSLIGTGVAGRQCALDLSVCIGSLRSSGQMAAQHIRLGTLG
ncbi:hypothetical protein IG631_03957 [Alternaria alternata]|nr:hypothetical protein IG631_03957 [Alternaria alternata]